eukprot:10664966-Lingulodinium_polyedra.AAC.1
MAMCMLFDCNLGAARAAWGLLETCLRTANRFGTGSCWWTPRELRGAWGLPVDCFGAPRDV